MPSPTPLLRVDNVSKMYKSGFWGGRTTLAVDGVSFDLEAGRTLALVGESGSGKSTLCRAALGLTAPTAGRVFFEGRNLADLNGDLKAFRKKMQMVFQDANGALNPRMKARDLLLEPARIHRMKLTDPDQWVQDLLDKVSLTPDLLCRRPHELSGGQRQRLALARAVSLSPQLIAADEPIASLDRSAQAQALNLMKKIQKSLGAAFIYVTHDLRTVKFLAHEMAVMYLGAFVEQGEAKDILTRPLHPYTESLLASAAGRNGAGPKAKFLEADPPGPFNIPPGCRFHPRCPEAGNLCRRQPPPLKETSPGRKAACFAI